MIIVLARRPNFTSTVNSELLFRHAEEGSYLVRPSSNHLNYAISLKMNSRVQHILVQTTLTGTGTALTVNRTHYFNTLKDLLDFYHVENIYGCHKGGPAFVSLKPSTYLSIIHLNVYIKGKKYLSKMTECCLQNAGPPLSWCRSCCRSTASG